MTSSSSCPSMSTSTQSSSYCDFVSSSSSMLRYCAFEGETASNFMLEALYIPFCISFLYLTVIFFFNMNGNNKLRTVKDGIVAFLKAKFGINKSTRPVWNMSLCIFSLLGSIHVTSNLFHRILQFGFYSSICESPLSSWGSGVTGFWIALFVISKVIELGDTFYLLVMQYDKRQNKPTTTSKKQPIISFLHWYHHATVLPWAWYEFTQRTSMCHWFASMNYTVHAFMYGYFALNDIMKDDNNTNSFRVRWGYRITILQCTQMVLGLAIVTIVAYHRFMAQISSPASYCDTSNLSLVLSGWIYFSYLFLFVQFAEKKYGFYIRFKHYIQTTSLFLIINHTMTSAATPYSSAKHGKSSVSTSSSSHKTMPWQKQNMSISEQFETATKLATLFGHVTTPEDLMSLYGAYKQVTNGPIPNDFEQPEDGMDQMKWIAWNNHRRLSKVEAQLQYIQTMNELAKREHEENQQGQGFQQKKYEKNQKPDMIDEEIIFNPRNGENFKSDQIDDPFVLYPIKIAGIGAYLPKRVVENKEIDEELKRHQKDGKKKRNTGRTGVTSRHYADVDNGENSIQNASRAIRMACEKANMQLDEIDLIIGGSGTPHQCIPDDACLVQRELGLGESGIPAFCVNATCLSFLVGLNVAGSFMTQQRLNAINGQMEYTYKNVVVFSSCISSVCLDRSDSHSSGLFGDGAAAVVLQSNNCFDRNCDIGGSVGQNSNRNISAIHRFHLETYGVGSDLCRIEGGGTNRPSHHLLHNQKSDFFQMDGVGTLRLVSKHLGPILGRFLPGLQHGLDNLEVVTKSVIIASNKLNIDKKTESSEVSSSSSTLSLSSDEEDFEDRASASMTAEKTKIALTTTSVNVDWVVPHQASGLALDSLSMFGWSQDKVLKTIHKYGNCVGASIPLTLWDGIENGKIKRGDKVLLCGTSAGVSFGAILLTY